MSRVMIAQANKLLGNQIIVQEHSCLQLNMYLVKNSHGHDCPGLELSCETNVGCKKFSGLQLNEEINVQGNCHK